LTTCAPKSLVGTPAVGCGEAVEVTVGVPGVPVASGVPVTVTVTVPVASAASRLAVPGVVDGPGVADFDGVTDAPGVVVAPGVPVPAGVPSAPSVAIGDAPVAALEASALRLEIAASPIVLSCWEVRWLSAVAVISSAVIGTPQAVTSRRVATGRSSKSRARRFLMP
jgi:hypothetical protein